MIKKNLISLFQSFKVDEFFDNTLKNKYILIVKIWSALSKEIFISSLYSENNTKSLKFIIYEREYVKKYIIYIINTNINYF